MSRLVLDRHLLASGATPWDTAWRSYGWTPALEGARAGRLEEEVPWGTRSARSDDPPLLSGSLEAVLAPANVARLGRALLPADGRLGFSVWGAVGPDRVGSEWRVATHTVLLGPDDLRALAGHPEALLAPAGRPAPWLRELSEGAALREPGVLEPVVIDAGPAARAGLAAARLVDLEGLVARARADRGGDRGRLVEDLSAVYEALAAALAGGDLRHVAVPVDDGGAGQAFLRLVWLSLPLEDRAAVSWVTEQRRAERPPGHLLGLPRDEWGRYVPGDAWVLGRSEPVGPVSPGRRHWAEALAAGGDMEGFRRLDARAGARGLRIVGRDDLRRVGEHVRWRDAWAREGPDLARASELVRREAGRPGGARAGAVGHALGQAVAAPTGAGAEAAVEEAVGLLRDFGDPASVERGVRGAVRALRDGSPFLAGLLRVTAARRAGSGTRRLVDRESRALRALLRGPGGPAALVRGAFPAAAAGDPVALELARLGMAEGTWLPEEAARLAGALAVEADGGLDVVAELVTVLVREGRPDAAEAVVPPLLERTGPEIVLRLAPALIEAADGGTGPERGPLAEAAEVVRGAALLRAADGGGRDLDDAVVALIELGRMTAPPSERPGPWRALLEAAPAPWLSRTPLLAALTAALGAGSRPFGRDRSELASLLARRVLERAAPGTLDDRQREAVLRLVWAEGDGATLRWLVGVRPDAAPALLAGLLVSPAPLPLCRDIRAAFVDALDTGASTRGLEPLADELRTWAPALAERAGVAWGARPARAPGGTPDPGPAGRRR